MDRSVYLIIARLLFYLQGAQSKTQAYFGILTFKRLSEFLERVGGWVHGTLSPVR